MEITDKTWFSHGFHVVFTWLFTWFSHLTSQAFLQFSPFLQSSTPSTGADRGAAAVRSGVRFEGHQDAG